MIIHRLTLVGVALFSYCLPSFSEEASLAPTDCEKRLEQFVPEEVDTSVLAMRAVVTSTRNSYLLPDNLREKQLRERYWASSDRQKKFPTPEVYIDMMMTLIAEEEKNERSSPPRHEKVEVIVTEKNAYARYFDAADSNMPTQEVVQMKVRKHEWRTIRVDHIQKRISETIEKNRNEYFNYFSALTPESAHRHTWQWYPVLLRMENRKESLAELLCKSGRVEVGPAILSVEFTEINMCKFTSRTKTGNKVVTIQYDLERGENVRLLRFELQGHDSYSQVTYEYPDAVSQWPSKRVLEEGKSDEPLLQQRLNILEVTPAEKWDFNAILNAMMKKYASYPYEQE